MVYNAVKNEYICAGGKPLRETHEKHSHTASGLPMTTSVYECSDCEGCHLKEKCIRANGSKKPLKERHKVIYVSAREA